MVFFGRLSAICPTFDSMSDEHKLKTLLCPATAAMAKCVSKYLGILSKIRKEIDMGLRPEDLFNYIKHANT